MTENKDNEIRIEDAESSECEIPKEPAEEHGPEAEGCAAGADAEETAADNEPCEGEEAEEGACGETEGAAGETAGAAQAEELAAQMLRLRADFDNFRRRSEKEKSDIYAFANEKIFVQLLDVIDNFERAMETAAEGDKFAEGMGLILKQLTGILEKNHVKEIEAEGKPFDPNFHNAALTEPAPEGMESGTVLRVLQKGYMLNDKVIRPSMVSVTQ